MADLDEIMSDRGSDSATEQPAQTEQKTEPRSDGRDEHGRFASQQPPETPPQPEAPAEQRQAPPDGFVPIQALDARLAKQEEKFQAQLRERDAQIQRFLEAQRQPVKPPEPVKPPDYFEDPDAAVKFRLQEAMRPVEQGQQSIVENFSRMMASEKYGEDKVQAALAEMTSRVNANPQATRFDYQRIMSSPHPYGELVKWHNAQTALQTYGEDPTAYREKLRAEILAEMGGQQPQTQPGAQPPPVLPTSFAGARNAGPSSAPAYSGPRPLSDIMNGR